MSRTMPRRLNRALLRLVPARMRRFASDQSGVSALEFALVLPLLLTLYLGGVQVADAVAAGRKVTLVSRTVADLTAQVANLDPAGVDTVLNAAAAVMYPYGSGDAATKLTVRLSLIRIDAQSNATVVWSRAKNNTPLSKDSPVTVPAALAVPNTSLVFGEASYSYDPPLGHTLTGTIVLNDKIYMRPRLSDTVACAAC